MAFCNTFNTLKKPTGTFLTFSQYINDLTKWNSFSENYKLIPSKFISIDIPNNEIFDNNSVVKILQDYFENACTIFRGEDEWTPEWARNLFWKTMFDKGFILKEDDKISNIQYVGDINIQSHYDYDNIGYSEIYCHIPNNECKYEYTYITTIPEKYSKIVERHQGDCIEGFKQGDLNGMETINEDIIYDYDVVYNFSWEDKSLNTILCKNVESFNINSIIVLYDIYNNNEILYSGIPMGIYFTGLIKNGNIENNITKYVSNEEIYNSGTSYGLRICSKFVINNDSTFDSDIVVDNTYDELSHVLSQIAISQTKMDEIINKTYNVNQNYKDLLAIFKNSRTNVPYIKNVNGVNYWFVNGRILQPASYNISSENENCDCIDLQVSIKNNVILCTDTSPVIRYIDWVLKKGDLEIEPDFIYINDEKQSKIISPIELTIDNPKNPTIYNYDVVVEINGEEIEESTYLNFVWPSYWGLVDTLPDDLNDLNQIVSEIRSFNIKYTNDSLQHICYIYPKYFGELTSIKDSRDVEYINDFDKILKTYVLNGQEVEYYAYIDKHPANVFNYTLNFK